MGIAVEAKERALVTLTHAAVAALQQHALHLWRWSQTRAGRRFYAIFGAALLLRLTLAPIRGFNGDFQFFVSWGVTFNQHPLHIYSAAPGMEYPPLTIYLFGLLTGIYGFIQHTLLGHPHPSFVLEQSSALSAFLRLPLIAADLATAVIIYALGRRFASERRALLFLALYTFMPAILLDGSLWGQTDGLMVFCTLLALVLVARRQVVWGGVVFGLDLMIKPQPICLLPLALLFLLRWAGWRAVARFLGVLVGTCVVICLPYLLPPHPEMLAFYHNLRATAGFNASPSAFNLWWLFGFQGSSISTSLLGPLTISTVGWLLYALVLLAVAIGTGISTSRQLYFLGAALLVLAFFDCGTFQHERYIIPAISLFLVAGYFSWVGAIFALVAGTTMFLNHAIILLQSPGFSHPVLDGRNFMRLLAAHPMIITIISAANVVLLAGALADYLLIATRQAQRQRQRAIDPSGAWGYIA